ncbi:hypothetical protein M0Q50_01285 [bacterium]|jgi:hypothetical protein|nr:hypothetical protein [bacterium]
MKTYREHLDYINKSNIIFEKAFSKSKVDKINRLLNSSDFSEMLNIVNKNISKLKSELKKINFDDIEYISNKNKEIEIIYNVEISILITNIKNIISRFDDDLIDKIFQSGYRDMNLEIKLSGEFNQIDIMNGLPNFMKGLGLGKKIYRKMIKDYNYVSSFNGFNPSRDSDLVWNSIATNDKDIYIFMNDDNIICFWNEYEFDKIVEKLKDFYKIKGVMTFDDDFLLRYELDDDKMKELLS